MPGRSKEYKAELEAAMRRNVCEAVFRLIARCRTDELGMDIFAMDAIAGESGVATGTLYNYFEGKDDLIACVIEESFGSHTEKEAEIAGSDLPTVDKLRAFCKAVLNVPIEASKVLYILSAHRQPMSAVEKVFARMSRESQNTITAIMEEGLREGIFEEIPAERLMLEFSEITDTFVVNGLLWEEAYPLKDKAETIVRLFMDGAGGEPPQATGKAG